MLPHSATPVQAVAPSLSSATATADTAPPRRSSTGRVRDSFAAIAQQEKALQSDPKYRKYATAVDKTLQAFDQVNEWADFITFLAKLLKCLQAAPQFPVIPHKLIVAKRLSQCLNPALPTGVHQRALDVYTHILTTIGPDNLRRDLPAWSSGLFPFFQYAATSVKPIVLNMYERFYLPLQEDLRPATKAFILALLPGLEEETGEWFEKVAALLDRLSGTVSPSFFFQNLWLVLITAPTSRIPAINYLSRRLPKVSPVKTAPNDAQPTPTVQDDDGLSDIVGQDVGLMVRGFAAALEDDKVLVQRGILDLLNGTLRLDSPGFRNCRRADQVLLMRAVLGVVLRRDLSLSRRLYTWLLGSSDASSSQVEHLRAYGLSLLHESLLAEMSAVAGLASDQTTERQRPFKIFISLLDKWEIGANLTEVGVLDAFQALKEDLRPGDAHDDLLMTGNMLFEVLDPFLLWKQLYLTSRDEVEGIQDGEKERSSSLELARFVIRTFRIHDEEVQKLHAPVVAFALLDTIKARSHCAAQQTADPMALVSALELVDELLREVPSTFFQASQTPSAADNASVARPLADVLYSSSDMKSASLPEVDGRVLLAAGLSAAFEIVEACVAEPHANAPATFTLTAVKLLTRLHEVVLDLDTSGVDVVWQPADWINSIAAFIASTRANPATFRIDAALVKLILDLAAAQGLRPPAKVDRRSVVEVMAKKLLDYLVSGNAPCYLEAADLLWQVGGLSPRRDLETMISAHLGSPDPVERARAFESFGNLWRFVEDAQLPGVVLRKPMFAMLDSLKSEDLATRRAAEAWMRCSLKSYIRVLDPLVLALLDPAIKPLARTVKIDDVRVPVLAYAESFDQAVVLHALDNLLALARFGGQGFIRIAKGSFLKHTLDPALRERVLTANLETLTYLDGMIALLLRFLRADPDGSLNAALAPLNSHIHAVVAELLQVLISRGESELAGISTIESSLMVRLYLSVHREELDLQNKLLHVLHSVTFANGGLDRSHAKSASVSTTLEASANEAHPPDLTRDEFFVRIVSDAIAQHNNAVTHHWVDFLLMTIQQFRRSLQTVLLPLIDCLCARLAKLVRDFQECYTVSNLDAPMPASSTTDAEFTVLTNALERLLLMAVAETAPAGSDDDARSTTGGLSSDPSSSATGGGGGGLLGYMTGVLSHQELDSADVPEQVKLRHQALQRLRSAVDVLILAWDITAELEGDVEDDRSSSQTHFAVRMRVRGRRALERLNKTLPHEVLENITSYWHRERPMSPTAEDRLFAMLKVLSPSALGVVTSLCERVNPKSASSRRPSPLNLADSITFAFLEAYLERAAGATAVQVWPTLLAFAREILANQSANRSLLFPTLRCVTTLTEKASQTSALEDRRVRRELQDTFVRLADATIQAAGRASESSSWLRKSAPDETGDTDSLTTEKGKADGQSSIMNGEKKSASEKSVVLEITLYLAQRVVPGLRRFLIDADRTASICSNMIYYIVGPALKTRTKSIDADPVIFELLHEMSQNSHAVKAWRSLVSDTFTDNRFFNASPSADQYWGPLIQALVTSDKERFADLASKVSTTSSANIFTNRELESLSRALALRRLTYILLSGPKDRYLTQLPIIQEKLVDLLRAPVGDMVHAEVYLCLRVLFCRIDNQHLSGLWPVILTELLRLFDSLVEHAVPDGSDLLQLVFSACKFLDLTLVLQTEDFQIHEWMFVTDTVDAIYPPDSWLPQAIMDRLGDMLSNPRSSSSASSSGQANASSGIESGSTPLEEGESSAARRPILKARRVGSIHELDEFFGTVSLTAYESVYMSGTRVDHAAVERSLRRDVFEGA